MSRVRSTKMRLRVSSLSISSSCGMKPSRNCFELRDEAFRQIANLAADARVGSGETRAGQQLEKIIEFLALGEGVEKHRHRAEIERHRAEAEQCAEMRAVSQQMTRIALPRGGNSQPISFSTASA